MSNLEKALLAARLYAGSSGCRIKDQQKLYDRMARACAQVAKATKLPEAEVIRQVQAQAAKLGCIYPIPGQHI